MFTIPIFLGLCAIALPIWRLDISAIAPVSYSAKYQHRNIANWLNTFAILRPRAAIFQNDALCSATHGNWHLSRAFYLKLYICIQTLLLAEKHFKIVFGRWETNWYKSISVTPKHGAIAPSQLTWHMPNLGPDCGSVLRKAYRIGGLVEVCRVIFRFNSIQKNFIDY